MMKLGTWPRNSMLAVAPSTFTQQRKTARMMGAGTAGGGVASSTLNMICLDQNEFEIHVGRAMDVLRSDYPTVLTQNPDFSIYDKELEVIDPAGVTLHGISNYKAVFKLLHAVIGVFYCPERSCMSYRMCYDKARQNIRIHWNAQVIPRVIFGGAHSTLHVDGISIYEVSRVTGNVTQHRIEKLMINDRMVMPEQGVVTALRGYAAQKNVAPIPVFNYHNQMELDRSQSAMPKTTSVSPDEEVYTLTSPTSPTDCENPARNDEPLVVLFQPWPLASASRPSLFAEDGGRTSLSLSPSSSSSASSSSMSSETKLEMSQTTSSAFNSDNLDWEALERKNASRKKFGLPPLSPEEFLDLQKQVEELDSVQRERAAASAAEIAAANKKKEKESNGFLKKMLGNVLEDTCESNFDCERPQVCCDFGFKKMCCTSGMRVVDGPRSRQGQLAEVPVIANPNPYPPMGRPGGGGYSGY
jgi:hypothetical protein